MKDKTLFKKRIAKEILFFFGAIGLVVIVWVSLLLRNTYYSSREKNLKEEMISLKSQLDKLPSDKIKAIYDGLCNNFVVNYRIANDTILEDFNQDANGYYAIPKRSEDEFLNDFPKAFRLKNYSKGYSYIHKFSVTLKDGEVIRYSDKEELGKLVKAKYPEYSDISDIELGKKILNKYSQHSDSTIIFDFIDLESFRNFLKQKDYRDKFYQIFRWEKYLRVTDNQEGLPVYKRTIAYDLGSNEVFESNVQLGLKYDKGAIETRNKIEQEIISIEKSVKTAIESIWDAEKIKWFLLNAILIITIILYPLRLTFILIMWAIKTVK
jgi:hypothetical protein